MIESPSPNFDARPPELPIDMLVFHYTGMESAAAALQRLCDPLAKVSAHYLVDEDGTVYRLVAEPCRAWHAGQSRWRGSTEINGRSIGIELANPGHEFGYRPFTDAQVAAVVKLAVDIIARHKIPGCNVVGHSDVAPTRKMDPGELFDWPRLAAAGVGLWPADSNLCHTQDSGIRQMLEVVGYDVAEPRAALEAFQRHYRPEQVDGRVDFTTARRLAALLKMCERCR